MMKISTKGLYALRMMIEFGLRPNEYTNISQVASRQGISEKYLEQIVMILAKAGFVKSIRGSRGGYALTRDPSEYTVGMILRLTEGGLTPVACTGDPQSRCDRWDTCATLSVWKKLDEAINQVVDSVTLEDLVREQRSLPLS